MIRENRYEYDLWFRIITNALSRHYCTASVHLGLNNTRARYDSPNFRTNDDIIIIIITILETVNE